MSPAVEIVDRAAANAREQERDRKEWNLPARSVETDSRVSPDQDDSHDAEASPPDPLVHEILKVDITAENQRAAVQDGLSWEGFSAKYFPESRRHNLKAIVAYGAYKRGSPQGRENAEMADTMIREGPLEAWESEGGGN
jgi:hypothetical protein